MVIKNYDINVWNPLTHKYDNEILPVLNDDGLVLSEFSTHSENSWLNKHLFWSIL